MNGRGVKWDTDYTLTLTKLIPLRSVWLFMAAYTESYLWQNDLDRQHAKHMASSWRMAIPTATAPKTRGFVLSSFRSSGKQPFAVAYVNVQSFMSSGITEQQSRGKLPFE